MHPNQITRDLEDLLIDLQELLAQEENLRSAHVLFLDSYSRLVQRLADQWQRYLDYHYRCFSQ